MGNEVRDSDGFDDTHVLVVDVNDWCGVYDVNIDGSA